MAPVNPTIQPRNDPSYGNNSRPVDVPDTIKPRGVATNDILPEGQKIGDKSAEFQGQADAFGYKAEAAGQEAFGDLFTGIAKVGDFLGKAGVELVKKDIENKVYDVANAERESYTAALEQVKAGVGTKNILAPGPYDTSSSGEAPQEVQDLGENLDVLTGARNAGKISSTYYEGRLLAEAKNLRAKYPGFRQEIDEAFSKVTGSNPANAYVRSLVTDINRAQGQANSTTQKTLTYIRQNIGIPGAQELYNAVSSGQLSGPEADQAAVKLFAPHEQLKVKVQEHKAIMDDVNLSRDEKSYQANKLYEKASAGVINNAVTAVMNRLHLTDEASVASTTNGLQSGAIDPKTWEAEGQNILRMKAIARNQLIAAADKNGVTENLKGGKDELIKKVDASLAPFDTIADLIYKKDTGSLFSLQRDMVAQTDQDKRDLLGNSKFGPFYRQVKVFRDIGGENYMKDLNLSTIQGNIPAQYKEWYKGWSNEIASQSMYGPNGKPSTFNDLFDDMKTKGINAPEASKRILNQIDGISDPKVPDSIKENLALAAFSPGNQKMISRLQMDGFDAKGRPVQGQNAIFQKFTTPEKTADIVRLSKNNPDILKNYVNWAETTLGNELIPRELADLGKLGNDKNLKISWDSDNKRFGVTYTPLPDKYGAVLPSQAEGYAPYSQARLALNRINSNLSNFKNIAEATGQDVDTFLLQTIRNVGGDLSRVQGIPSQMLQGIDATRNFEGRFGASQRRR